MGSLRRLQAERSSCSIRATARIDDPQAKIAEYIDHRQMRERRLVAALERGERSRDALLAEVWDDVPRGAAAAAAIGWRRTSRSSRTRAACRRVCATDRDLAAWPYDFA